MNIVDENRTQAHLDQCAENILESLNKATDNLLEFVRTFNHVRINSECAASED